MDDELKATLVYTNRAEASLLNALDRHLRAGELFDAALAARALGRPAQAAQLFEQARHYAEAAACWHEAKEYRRCLLDCARVPRDHALYPSCAKLAVEAASALNEAGVELDALVRPWMRRGPRDTYDSEALLELGDLYQRVGRREAAQQVYELLVRVGEGVAQKRLIELHTKPASQAPRRSSQPVAAPATRSPGPIDGLDELSIGPGAVLAGRYRLEELRGSGGSAYVYRATDLVLDQQVAIKLFGGPEGDERNARFKREINLARRLAHDHIVRIFDLVLSSSVQGLTMELIEGEALDDFVKARKPSLALRKELVLQAARALGYAHGQGVIHRDIKPGNLLVTKTGRLKVTDFGIAKACEEASITVTGAFAGTPYYVAPEQIASFRSVDHRADLYSLGVVAYELFTGKRPFEAHSVVDVLTMHTSTEPRPARSVAPSLPAELDGLILELLAKQPEDRVQTCEELVRRLSRISLPQ